MLLGPVGFRSRRAVGGRWQCRDTSTTSAAPGAAAPGVASLGTRAAASRSPRPARPSPFLGGPAVPPPAVSPSADGQHSAAPHDGSAHRVLRPSVVEALALPPGPELLTTLTTLAAEDLSARERTEVVVAWRSMTALCEAGRLDAIAALDRSIPHPVDRAASLRPAAEQISTALALAPTTASRTVSLARRLDRDLPTVADALADGLLDLAHARLVAAITRDITDPATTATLETLAVRHAPSSTVATLRRILETEAQRLLPGWAARRAARGRAERSVVLSPSPVPGCRRIIADLPALEAAAVWLGLNRLASSALAGGVDADGHPETRTHAQLRADVLTVLLTGTDVGAPPAPPTAQEGPSPTGTNPAPGVRGVALPPRERFTALAEVQVVVAADTLLGQSDLPAHVPGIGPLDAGEARTLATDARWRRLLVDPPSGTLLDRGTTVYRPPGRLRQHVLARDGTCVFPTCSEPATLTQVDHTLNFAEIGADGQVGTTSAHNTGALCPRHHDAKTDLGWQLAQPTPGRFTWTSPTGTVHRCAPTPVLTGWAQHRPDRHGGALAERDVTRDSEGADRVA